MLILVSCGALFLMWEKATELQSLEPSRDWTCLLSEQSANNNRPSWSLAVYGHLTAVPRFCCHVHSWKKRKKNKFGSVKLMPSTTSHAYSHLTSTGSKERGNCFQSAERRQKTDPDLSTGARTSSCLMWPPAKYSVRLKMETIDSNKYIHIFSHQYWHF